VIGDDIGSRNVGRGSGVNCQVAGVHNELARERG
jgi:hypothetical protein